VEVDVGSLVRLSRSPATEPWFGRQATGRFDDPKGKFGVCYAADSLEAAFAETVLHAACLPLPGSGQRLVSLADVTGRQKVSFRTCRGGRTLHLVDLSGPALSRLGGNNDLSAGEDYLRSQSWARRLHQASPQADGIRYVSRQYNTQFCYALFDRSALAGPTESPLDADEIDGLCSHFDLSLLGTTTPAPALRTRRFRGKR
jgi:hypothetical protein